MFFLGDQVERKGALTGGFNESHASLLQAMNVVRQCRAKLDELNDAHNKCDARTQTLDQQISELLGEIDKREAQLTTLRDAVEQLQNDLRTLGRERLALQASCEQRTATLSALRQALEPLATSAATLRDELAQPLHSKLSTAESDELHARQTEQSTLQSALAAAAVARADASRETTELEALLESNLLRREAELRAAADALALVDAPRALEQARRAASFAADAVKTVEQRLTGA